ncbi:hypothetical protein [Pseudomonas citronellolis]|uniref:hypothetical protein n=1 Tax=Pseudomonas citronellolis TaxID=53408 RepID=UPI0007183BE0|nr:hypothetical protein [Pseudomonas citronellolis]KRV76324.1 hypothetical protein AO742_12355 [Pseudomonas citronellolis]KRW79641.1 hypothetical protein AO738_13910 [Pseudomonas citronellolis]MCP1606018.1 hypothetical protein [Pseudomonas citronellolis]MCP1656572.1 hypothetical protein [Pseudomonas citronellolis]MCP1723601.1 hypothetical protein [Pseudomonas citronellolis]
MALVFGRIRINKTFEEWQRVFLEHRGAREAEGIEDVMHAPVVGSQEVIYVVRTAYPRRVHDMSWANGARAVIEASGHQLGSETYTVCDEFVEGTLGI